MKKLILIPLFFLAFPVIVFAQNLQDVGIAKYAVLEALQDNTPAREKPHNCAKRLTHLSRGTVLYADKKNDEFFRVEFARNEYGWVDKKTVEVQAIINDRLVSKVEKVKFDYDKNFTYIKVKTEMPTAYRVFEQDGFEVKLYDTSFNPNVVKASNKPGSVKLSADFDGSLNIKYLNRSKDWGHDAYYEKDEFIFKVRNTPKIKQKKPLNNITVVVNPGHGGKEPGAVAQDGTKEKDLNLQISKKLAKELRRAGAKVYLTRKRDKYVDLYERVAFAKEKEALILISMHQNSVAESVKRGSRSGTGVYYYNENAKNLAGLVHEQMVKDLKVNDDGVNFASFALNRPTTPISILIEGLYIINPDERELLKDKKFQNKMAESIRKGVEKFLCAN